MSLEITTFLKQRERLLKSMYHQNTVIQDLINISIIKLFKAVIVHILTVVNILLNKNGYYLFGSPISKGQYFANLSCSTKGRQCNSQQCCSKNREPPFLISRYVGTINTTIITYHCKQQAKSELTVVCNYLSWYFNYSFAVRQRYRINVRTTTADLDDAMICTVTQRRQDSSCMSL